MSTDFTIPDPVPEDLQGPEDPTRLLDGPREGGPRHTAGVTTVVFHRYRILRCLGEGGMGVVYLAEDPVLRRQVAVKMIQAERRRGEMGGGPLQPSIIERFLREAQLAAQLQHPNIVGVHEVGAEHGRHYLVMDYIEGTNLDALLSRTTPEDTVVLSIRDGLALVEKVARALHAAHEKGILHRDVKPANILIDSRGEPYLTDFGLAREIGSGSDLTLSGATVGTPRYMSPEQARGERDRLDGRSDVFSLGVVLYHILTGVCPFDAPNALDILRKVDSEDPIFPRRRNPRIARDVETVCLRALEKEPVRRYPTAATFADDVRALLRGEQIQARPPFWGERWWRRLKRNPPFAAALILGLTAILVVAILFGAAADEARRRTADLERVQAAHQSARDEAARIRARAKVHLERGKELFFSPDTGAVEGAAGFFQEAIRADETFAEAYEWRGRARAKLGLFREALADFETAVSKDPSLIVARYRAGQIRMDVFRDYGGARREFTALQHADEGSEYALLGRARLELFRSGFSAAEALCDRVEELNPHLDELHLVRGLIHMRGMFLTLMPRMRRREADPQVLESFQRALELNPSNVIVHLARGLYHLRLLQIDKGRLDMEEAAKLRPKCMEAYIGLAAAYLLEGNVLGAQAQLGVVAKGDPEHPLLPLFRGYVLQAVGQKRLAAEQFRLCSERLPGLPEAHVLRGTLALMSHDAELAEQEFRMVLEDSPGDAFVHSGLGQALMNQGRIEEAWEVMRVAMELAPEEEHVRDAWRGTFEEMVAHLKHRDATPEEMEAFLTSTLEVRRDASVLSFRGRWRLQVGRTDAGWADLEEAVGVDDTARSLMDRAGSFRAAGNWEGVLQDWEEAHRRFPEDPEVALQWAEALLGQGRYAEAEETLADLSVPEADGAFVRERQVLAESRWRRGDLGGALEALRSPRRGRHPRLTAEGGLYLVIGGYPQVGLVWQALALAQGDWDVDVCLAMGEAAGRLRDLPVTEAWAERAAETLTRRSGPQYRRESRVRLLLGEGDLATYCLLRSVAAGDVDMATLTADPILRRLKGSVFYDRLTAGDEGAHSLCEELLRQPRGLDPDKFTDPVLVEEGRRLAALAEAPVVQRRGELGPFLQRLAQRPADAELRLAVAAGFRRLREYDDVLRLLDERPGAWPPGMAGRVAVLRAQCLLMKGRPVAALAVLKLIGEAMDVVPSAYVVRTECLFRANLPESALAMVPRATAYRLPNLQRGEVHWTEYVAAQRRGDARASAAAIGKVREAWRSGCRHRQDVEKVLGKEDSRALESALVALARSHHDPWAAVDAAAMGLHRGDPRVAWNALRIAAQEGMVTPIGVLLDPELQRLVGEATLRKVFPED